MLTFHINVTRHKFTVVGFFKHNKLNKLKHPNKWYQACYQLLNIHEDLTIYG